MRAMRSIGYVCLVLLLVTACTSSRKKKYGQLCQADSACPSGSLCVGGRCSALQSCSSSSDCAIGVCSAGYCWTEQCSDTVSCPESLQCVEGYCIRGAETTKDTTDTSSEDQNVTPDQGVEKQCNVDADCTGKVGQLGICEEAWCNAGQCLKRNKPKGSTCDDGDKCTGDDSCDDSGVCQPGANICECQKDAECAKLDSACIKGTCNLQTNKCEPTPTNENGDCDDTNVCTVADKCVSGVCTGEPVFGLSCGSGVDEHCDLFGQCVPWNERRHTAPMYSSGIACTNTSDCPGAGAGYSCEGGLCVCTNPAGCTCVPGSDALCEVGRVCFVTPNVQAPDGKDYNCTRQSFTYGGVCRVTKQGADDSLYLVGANFLDYQYELDVIFTKMENDEPTEMQTARSGVGYWGTDTFSCSGPIANLIVAGEGVSSYLFRLDPSGKWNEETKLLDAMRTVGTNNYGDPLSVFSLRTSEDKLAVYLGGYFSASELQAPGETTPSTHRDFIVRCVEDSANPNGYSCEPRFIAMHDGKTDVDPEPTYAPPYGDLLEGVVTGMWGYLDKGVETIQTMSTIGYRTYDGNLGRIVEFSWWLSNASVEGGIWTFDPPNGCIGWQDGPCDTYGSHEVDYQYYSELNRGMYSIDGLNGVVMIAGMPKVPLFDDKKESVVQNPGNAPNVAPLFLKDSGGWSKLLYPPDQLLQDPKHFEGAPYEFLFDHVRFVNEKVVLLVGHYRTCLTDGCYNTSNVENAVTVKAQPFVTTYQLAAKTFGPMIPIGSGFERECCTGTSCQTLPNCLGYNVSAFWRNARPRGVDLRYRSDGVEIYMTLNPPAPSGDNTLPERQPIVYSFISLQP